MTVPDARVVIQPRTTGEILDDAWRLYLANAPLLLALSALFLIPAFAALLLLLAQPLPPGSVWRWLLPAVTAALLPLTGLGSGACQEAFRFRAEGKPAELGPCLAAALRRGLEHVAARGVTLILMMIGLLFLIFPGLAVWLALAAVHPILASGEGRLLPALGESVRESQRQLLKAVVILLLRLLLLAFALLNLHVLAHAGLWVAEHLGGMDTALLDLLLVLTNPVYLVALVLLAWLLLAPFGEAVNYFLHVDTRARYEGLDLWYRVQRHFPAGERAGVAGLVLFALLLAAAPAGAADETDRPRLSREDIKKLLPDKANGADPADPDVKQPPDPDKDRDPVPREDEPLARGRKRGPGLVGPSPGGGLATIGWLFLAGLLLAVLTLAIVLFRRSQGRARPAETPRTGPLAAALESILTDPGQSVAGLWRRAEELARQGQFLEAVRLLYLAVLALLHRANLVRYERTHTNGEYVRQLRQSAATPAALVQPFRRLVVLFEEKWYGERACDPEDYRACRGLAEEVRDQVPG